MRVRVSELSTDGVLIEDQLDPARFKELMALQDDDACRFHGMLAVRLRVIPTAGMFRVEGRITGAASLPCSRCLAPARWPLQSTFRLTFSRTIPGDASDSPPDIHELQADELGVVLFDGDEIDLRDVIQEQVIMALPMQPLCREDCRGLCASCGANLNDGSCECAGKEVDPRLAILKKLKLDS